MKSKKRYRKKDRVLVKSFAGPDVCVVLQERYIALKSEHKLGVDGWHATIIDQKEVEKLRKYGVPCLLYTSPSPRDRTRSRMPSSA